MHHISFFIVVLERHFGHADHAIDLGKERMIPAHADVFAGPKLLAALPYQNAAGLGGLAVKDLDAEAAADGIAAVVGGPALLLGGHAARGVLSG